MCWGQKSGSIDDHLSHLCDYQHQSPQDLRTVINALVRALVCTTAAAIRAEVLPPAICGQGVSRISSKRRRSGSLPSASLPAPWFIWESAITRTTLVFMHLSMSRLTPWLPSHRLLARPDRHAIGLLRLVPSLAMQLMVVDEQDGSIPRCGCVGTNALRRCC